MAFLQLFLELDPDAQMCRGLVKSPAEGTGASLRTLLAEGSNVLGFLCRMAGAVPMSLLQVHSGKSADFSRRAPDLHRCKEN